MPALSNVGPKVTRPRSAQVGIRSSWGGGNVGARRAGTCEGYRGSIRPCQAARTVGLDCSGLMLYAYADEVGITLDHYAAFQWLEGARIAANRPDAGRSRVLPSERDGPGPSGCTSERAASSTHHARAMSLRSARSPAYAGSYMGAVRPY